jgi:CheY-like chemotaxis protein
MGTVELLGRTRLTQKQKGYVENLKNTGNALMSLLNDVLQLAKSEAGKSKLNLSCVDLVAVTQSMCDLMSARAGEKGLSLEFQKHGDIPKYIEADEARLRQVLLNLIGNAVKFTEKGGVVVSLAGQNTIVGNTSVAFEVQDTGIGIEQKDFDSLFQPFVQLHGNFSQSTEGTGLGLSICRDLVRAMGGELEVESQPGKGSRFSFTLEFASAAEDTVAYGQNVQSVLPHVAPVAARVLVVDDVALNRDVLKELLQHYGYFVSVAQSGDEALQRVRSEPFDAIITDVFMPGMDGLELVRRLRKRRYMARIIGLTAAFDEHVRMDCLSVGFDLVLAKPASGETLHRSLISILDMPRPTNAAEENAPPVFDPEYIDGYFEALGPVQMSRLLDDFRETVDEEMERAAAAIEQKHTDLYVQALHKLGGALSTVGLLRLGRSLEATAVEVRSGAEISLEPTAVRQDLDAALRDLETYLDRKAAGIGVEAS